MKEKIMYMIIGALIGAIITASGFMIYNNTHKKEMRGGPGQMQLDGDRSDFKGRGGPGQNSSDSSSNRKSKPNNNSSSNNTSNTDNSSTNTI